jgi:hypothetical protein
LAHHGVKLQWVINSTIKVNRPPASLPGAMDPGCAFEAGLRRPDIARHRLGNNLLYQNC